MRLRREQVVRYRKYLYNIRHLTPRKLLNILRIEWKFWTNDPVVDGLHPYTLFVDLSNACNLKCPLCPTGLGNLLPRDNRMSLENYKRVVEPLKDYLYQVFLFNNTEPFLNREVYDIIEFNRASNIGSVVSSNLSLKIDARRLVASGLEYLIVSGDGVTQDVYGQYRVNGKVQLVIDNVRRIIEEKRKARSGRPFVEWQCLVTKKNEGQMATIEKVAYELGVDAVRFADTNLYAIQGDVEKAEREWLPENGEFRTYESERLRVKDGARRKPCQFLWRTAIVNSNGGINPCCLYDTPDWGNVLDQPFLDVWNNETYQKVRRLSGGGSPPASRTVCDDCQAPFIWKT